MARIVRVAAVQAAPELLNMAAGVAQVISLIEKASAAGVELVAFPETFIPGFPWWMWLDSVDWGAEFLERYRANSMTADGPELRAITYAARRLGIHVSLGFSERAGSAVYMSQALIDDQGSIEIARKAQLARLEHTVFTPGDPQLLVRDMSIGRVGVLGGPDHLRPELCARMHIQREQIHVASWPGFTVYVGEEKINGLELDALSSRRYAETGQTHVLVPMAVAPVTGWEVIEAGPQQRQLLRGGNGIARIFGPSGHEIVQPMKAGEEGLLCTDLVLSDAELLGTRRDHGLVDGRGPMKFAESGPTIFED